MTPYFSVTFVQDAQPTATELALLTPSNVGMVKASDDYLLDDKKFSDYGVRILRGTLAEAMKYADFKQPLTRNISTQEGTIYDRYNDYLRSKSRDFSVICLARAGSVSDLRKNLNCLLRDMIKPNERRLYITDTETEVSCFYKGCTVSDFSPEDVWLDFALTFTMTRPPRHFNDDILLESESGIVITTETNDNAIDVDPI